VSRPRLLDLFSGAGGAARGYQLAGFYVVGVDIRPQPRYAGDEFHQADALTYPLDGFDAIHASPPCQAYSPHVSSASSEWAGTLGRDEPRLIAAVRERLVDTGSPYVIENVVGARHELRPRLLLCGAMFGLPIPRHRLFETSRPIVQPWHPRCAGRARRYALERGWDPRDMTVTGKGRNAGTKERWAEVMGWPDYRGTQHGLREAIPPAFTEWIGRQLLASLERVA
jgi:DNA (cytosine-5)-methyltransferase 1